MSVNRHILPVVEQDPWLEPDLGELLFRDQRYHQKLAEIERAAGSIVDFANGYKYFGFQRDNDLQGWWFREWLPGAAEVFLFGDFNGWDRAETSLSKGAGGVWSVFLPDALYGSRLVHGSLIKMLVVGKNGRRERIPSYIRRAVQDDATKDFAGQLWAPAEEFSWDGDDFDISGIGNLLIYESHVGMARENEGVGSYREFADEVLPRIKSLGYNTVQLMAVAEHPYYGSFGYHVSNFFAPSSRFGTPEDLKYLIRKAHAMGLAVIMDIVQSHYVKNINEGLNELDDTDNLYSPPGEAGNHPYWGSKLFDYGKDQVIHFLLSNVKYWLDEFHFDGFRFDGVTSMIFHHHGYTEFDAREKYFNEDVNRDGLRYLALANTLVHRFRPSAVTIAEDVSGMPTMCSPVEDGGVGFDYRLGMAVPDFWIRMLKDVPDEQWNIWDIWNILTDRLPYVKTIAYTESHDQALVGDKTIAFRLMDKDMYTDMDRARKNYVIDRGMALHKMIRLVTISLGGQGYLNFMGNEFGHPDWVDFPREGNGWSYAYARRQWSLSADPFLRYGFLNDFDAAMIALVRSENILGSGYAYNLQMDEENKTMVFSHGSIVFVFNWHPDRSIPDYDVHVPEPGKYEIVMSTDEERFGGQGRHDLDLPHFTQTTCDQSGDDCHRMKIYNICRTAIVLRRV